MTLPLQRLKVLDLSQIMAGPCCCMLLGDMGAVVMDIEHPAEGAIKSLGFPVKMRGTPQQVRHPPRLLGQHTDEALSEFGFDRARLDALRASGAFDR